MISRKNDFHILQCLACRKIIVKGKHFPFNQKFIFNFGNIVYGFKNCKPFFDFEYLILKLTYLAKTHSRAPRDLTRTRLGLDQDMDSLGTCLGLDRDLSRDLPRPTRDLPRTCLGHDQNSHQDLPRTYLRPA
jgi:hypothetical protein